MNDLMVNAASEFAEQHHLAQTHAGEAIEHARRAGEILLRVKAELSHGQFLPWLATNVSVTPRQVQRYMAAAQGKPIPVRKLSNATPASHLNTDQRELPAKTGFTAIPDHAMWTIQDACVYLVEQSTTPNHFFVSCTAVPNNSDDVIMTRLTKPIRGDYVDVPLRDWGLTEPVAVAWRWCRLEQPVSCALELAA